MKKLVGLLLLAGAVCAAFAVLKQKMATADSSTFFERMQQKMEAMPEDFPPRVMFDNVAATRENTERILELLDKDAVAAKEPEAVAS